MLSPATQQSQQRFALVGIENPVAVSIEEPKCLSEALALLRRYLGRQILKISPFITERFEILNRDLTLKLQRIFRLRPRNHKKGERHLIGCLLAPFHSDGRMLRIAR